MFHISLYYVSCTHICSSSSSSPKLGVWSPIDPWAAGPSNGSPLAKVSMGTPLTQLKIRNKRQISLALRNMRQSDSNTIHPFAPPKDSIVPIDSVGRRGDESALQRSANTSSGKFTFTSSRE